MNKINFQSGQTLIETMVAAVVLVMGIAAAVGLAVYGLGATTGVNKQLIANGLAREGIEAVKNMRDTNWLRSAPDVNCFDFYTQSSIAVCYKYWLNHYDGYNIDPTPNPSKTYALGLDTTGTTNYWKFVNTNTLFGLDYKSSDQTTGMYSIGVSGISTTASNSGFGRKITISKDTFAPFNLSDLGPRIKVRVDVWWTDKRCPVSVDVPTTSKCLVTIETYLTNWKNY